MNSNDPSAPNYVHPEAARVQPDLDLIADLLAGTRRMWERSQSVPYCRRWADEKQAVYDIRRQSETLFEGLARVLSAAVGMLFAKDPSVEWNASETAMDAQWENLDGRGTAGVVLAKRFSEQALRDGIGLILVDHPPAPAGVVVTAANEAELNLRPIWALYPRTAATSWRTALVNNVVTLTQLVLAETSTEASGVYGITEKKRYRVLRLDTGRGADGAPDGRRVATWELWEETTDGLGNYKPIGAGTFKNRKGETAHFLPVAIAYTGRSDAPMCATIPLLGVAWANLAHWQLSTNLRFYRDLCAFPQPVVVGELASEIIGGTTLPGKLKIGPAVSIHLHGEGASFEWKAPPTEAFDALERGVKEKLEQMGQMGLMFLVSDTRAAETATAKQLDATAENSTLATAARGITDAINQALIYHAWYLGIEAEQAPELSINTDFEALTLDPQTMSAYVDAVVRAGLPPRLLLEAWQRGGRIPAETDLEELELEMSANAAATEDAAMLGTGQPTVGVPAAPGKAPLAALRDAGVAEAPPTLQDAGLNGAQVTAVLAIVEGVAAGNLPMETGKALVKMAFPSLDETLIDRVFAALRGQRRPPKTVPVAPGLEESGS